MKKKAEIIRLTLGVITGLLGGVMLMYGVITIMGRSGMFGGEVLILPALILCFVLGYEYGKTARKDKLWESYRNGYYWGIKHAEATTVHIDTFSD